MVPLLKCPVHHSSIMGGNRTFVVIWRKFLRDWSRITGRGGGGGATKREGHVKFYPCEKGGGGGNSFRHAEGGGAQQVLGYFLCSS